MHVVSLDPLLTDIMFALHDGSRVDGVTHLCRLGVSKTTPTVVTKPGTPQYGDSITTKLLTGLSGLFVDWNVLDKGRPATIVTRVVAENPGVFIQWAEGYLQHLWSKRVRIVSVDVVSLNSLYEAYQTLGTVVATAAVGRDRAQRVRSQLLDWGRNLYERLRNKKVVVLSSFEPLEVAGGWVSDIIKLVSARPFLPDAQTLSEPTTWEEIGRFAPDAILLAPRGFSVNESVKLLRKLEDIPQWEKLPAVKRGEVGFSDGIKLYQTGAELLEGAGALISVIAGLDSGYITKKDDFFRLRYVELHRHKFA